MHALCIIYLTIAVRRCIVKDFSFYPLISPQPVGQLTCKYVMTSVIWLRMRCEEGELFEFSRYQRGPFRPKTLFPFTLEGCLVGMADNIVRRLLVLSIPSVLKYFITTWDWPTFFVFGLLRYLCDSIFDERWCHVSIWHCALKQRGLAASSICESIDGPISF